MVNKAKIAEEVFEKKANWIIWLAIAFFVAVMLVWPMVKPLLSKDDGTVKQLEIQIKKQEIYNKIIGDSIEYQNRAKIDSLILEAIKNK